MLSHLGAVKGSWGRFIGAVHMVVVLLPVLARAQDEPLSDPPRPWVEFMLGSRLPGGFFGIAGGVHFGRFIGPSVSLGLGGGPDGASVALGNEVIAVNGDRIEVRGFAYWNHAFGREVSDGSSAGYRTVTDPSRSLKAGASLNIHTSVDCSFALRAGWSWAQDVPEVTEETPGGSVTHPSDETYFSDALLLGGGVTIWIGRF